jgi:hypothetical protein
MAGDRGGHCANNGMRRQSGRPDSAREHRRFLQCEHHRIIDLLGEYAIDDARAQCRRGSVSDRCDG